MNARAAAGAALYLLLLPLLGWVPHLFAAPSGTASASAVVGYHNGHAYLLFAGWIALSVLILSRLDGGARQEDLESPRPGEVRPLAVFLGAAAGLVLYNPLALARYGPFVEDDYWLTLLHRMEGGMRPYVDFESLYGPLMIKLPHLFIELFGYSATAYYTFIAVAEASLIACLILLFSRLVPRRSTRWILLGVLFLLTFNTLVGVSWNAWRRVAPVLILLYFVREPLTLKTSLGTGAMVGLLLAYSHDFGVLTVAAVLGLYIFAFFWEREREALPRALTFGLVGLLTWGATALVLLGADVEAYFSRAIYGAARFAAEASFPFYWTLNSLAAFGLLLLTAMCVAGGLSLKDRTSTTPGDRLLLGAFGYAIVAMKSGLNRADMWHVATPLLPLLVALLLPWSRRRFPSSPNVRRLSRIAIGVVVATYVLALLPTGSLFARGLVAGTRDWLTGAERPAAEARYRSVSIEPERSRPRDDIVRMARFIADRPDARVLLYGNAWDMDKRVGVFRVGYPTDDFLLSDDAGRALAKELTVGTLVLIRRRPYHRLQQPAPVENLLQDSVTKRLLSVLSTIHYSAAQLEYEQKERRWARTVGLRLVETSTRVFTAGDLVLLEVVRSKEDIADER